MKTVWILAKRDLSAYLRTLSGYVILAVVLFANGMAFNAFSMGTGTRRSAEILHNYFYWTSGLTMTCALLLSMRLLAEERQTGTLNLLYSSPITDLQIVLGKFLSSLLFLGLYLAATLYMPLLIVAHGKISLGHLFTGYLGLVLVGASATAIGLFASSLTKSQVVAVIVGGVMAIALSVLWFLAPLTERPFTEVLEALGWYGHFKAFGEGILQLKHLSYFLLLTYFGLFATTRVLEARRWR